MSMSPMRQKHEGSIPVSGQESGAGRAPMQARSPQSGAPASEAAKQNLDRQGLRSPRATTRVRGANLGASGGKRLDPNLNAIKGASRVPSDPAPSFRMALGVSGAITNQVLEDQGLLVPAEGEAGVKAAGALERHQVVLRRHEERSAKAEAAVNQVFGEILRKARFGDLNSFQQFMVNAQQAVQNEGFSTVGGALFEAAVLGQGLQMSREFSEVPSEARLEKARFYALQRDAFRVVGREEGGLSEPGFYGFSWRDAEGRLHLAGLRKGRNEAEAEKDGVEPHVPYVVTGAVLRSGMEGPGHLQEVQEEMPLADFLADHGVEIEVTGDSVTSQDLRTFRENGLTPILIKARTGDFMPSNIQERLIPGCLVFDGCQGKIADMDRLMEIGEDIRANLDTALEKWARQDENRARIESIASSKGRTVHDLLVAEKDKQVYEAELKLGVGLTKALMCLKDYLQEREALPKTVRPDPFQVNTGRDVTSLLAEFGFDPKRDRNFYIDLDMVLDKAQEKFGSEPEITVVKDGLQKHILVMRRAMEEIRNMIVARLKLKPESDEGQAKIERIDAVLGPDARDRINAEFLRVTRGIMEKGQAIMRQLAQVQADAVLDAMLTQREFVGPDGTGYSVNENETMMLRSRLSVFMGALDDPYVRTAKTITRGQVTEWREAQPKSVAAVNADAKIEAFIARGANGEYLNRALRAALYSQECIIGITENAEHIRQLPQTHPDKKVLSEALAFVQSLSAADRARILRARESFKFVDTVLGAMESHRKMPDQSVRLVKGLGAIMRDGQEDALKGTNPFDAVTPSAEEGRAYIVPIKEGNKGVGFLVLRLERSVEGHYKMVERSEVSEAQFRQELDRLNYLDYATTVLRHAMERGCSNTDVMQHFGAYDLGEGRFLLSVQSEYSGPVAEALGWELRGGLKPDASYEPYKDCFIKRVPSKDSEGATRLDANGAEVPVRPGEELGSPHTYLAVREKGSRYRRNVFIPIPGASADIPAHTKALATWMDRRLATQPANRSAMALYDQFKTVVLEQYETLATRSIDEKFGGFAALRPRGQGIFQPDMLSQVILPRQDDAVVRAGRQDRVKAGGAAIGGLGELINLRSRLLCDVEIQTVTV